MKYFRMSYEEVVFKRSYLNLLLLNAAIPGIKPHDEDGEEEYQAAQTGGKRTGRKAKGYTTADNGNSFFSSLM